MAQPWKEVADKSLPATPIPSPLPVVGRKSAKHKRHSSGEIVGSPPVTPRRTLSKRRTSMPGPVGMIPDSSSPKAQEAKERAVNTIVVLDHESGSLRRKRIHRRSATVHTHPREVHAAVEPEDIQRPLTAGLHTPQLTSSYTVTTTVRAGTSDIYSQAGTGNGGGVLSSLRRSLSLGRSTSGRPRSRSRDRKVIGGKDEARGRTPPLPQLPVEVKEKLERKRQHAVNQVEISPPVSLDSKAAVSEKSPGHGGVTGAVMAGIASIKKRKSKVHLHHPGGQFYLAGSEGCHDQTLVSTTSNTHVNDQVMEGGISMLASSQMKKTQTAPIPPNTKLPPQKVRNKSRNPEVLKINSMATCVAPAGSAPANPPTPTTPRAKSRRNSSAISNLLNLRPKSRTGMSAPVSTEPVPPMPASVLTKPVLQQQTLAIKNSNVGNSAILAGIRDLQNGKTAQVATPGFRLQGVSGATTQSETRLARRTSLVGSSHTVNAKGGSESGKKGHETSAGGSPAQAQRKNSFLVKF
ncbi:hypothetical protein L211DRAFT_524121 [Terfezia boudieri ATCC MYA-4762]|uniref:Uncharacterized protein n=1 Tax=Terfezia boudieri ATCC MYA-4762 TaxID=1051890 RepID=A0A3N4LI75_9PEZI|nr:hypothetical protein L211DRAFT_524121 [Terfezia boudieri ATCC MYA-4762]